MGPETDASLSVHHLYSVHFYSMPSISTAYSGGAVVQVRLSHILLAYVCVLVPKETAGGGFVVQVDKLRGDI